MNHTPEWRATPEGMELIVPAESAPDLDPIIDRHKSRPYPSRAEFGDESAPAVTDAVDAAKRAYAFHAEHCDHDDCLRAALNAAFPALTVEVAELGREINDPLTGWRRHCARWRDRAETAEREAERLRADAARGRWMIGHAAWLREDGRTHMMIRVGNDADLSCYAMREAAVDAARTTPEGR